MQLNKPQRTLKREHGLWGLGVAAQMETFDYFFGLELGQKCLDYLSQASTMSACEGQEVVKLSVQTLLSIRCEEHFIEHRSSEIDVSTAALPRVQKLHGDLKLAKLLQNILTQCKIIVSR